MILVLGGTVEARELLEKLDRPYLYSSYSDYGKSLSGAKNTVSGPKDIAALKSLLIQNGITKVVDLTHPYATEISKNAMAATQELRIPYLRFERKEECWESCLTFSSQSDAALFLKKNPGEIFITTGSKELSVWKDLKDRSVIRILPLLENLKKALDLGFLPSRIICAQGPFTKLENLAILKRYKIKYLVTKDGGKPALFDEKLEACRQAGTIPVLIVRPRLVYPKVTSELEEVLAFCYE